MKYARTTRNILFRGSKIKIMQCAGYVQNGDKVERKHQTRTNKLPKQQLGTYKPCNFKVIMVEHNMFDNNVLIIRIGYHQHHCLDCNSMGPLMPKPSTNAYVK